MVAADELRPDLVTRSREVLPSAAMLNTCDATQAAPLYRCVGGRDTTRSLRRVAEPRPREGQGLARAQPVSKAKVANAFAPRPRAIRRNSAVQVQAYKVTFVTPDGTSEVECEPGKFFLDAAEEVGVDLPYSCRAGACSSCAGIVEEGTVDHGNQTFLDDKQLKQGFVLTCYAAPTSDCTITTHKESDMY